MNRCATTAEARWCGSGTTMTRQRAARSKGTSARTVRGSGPTEAEEEDADDLEKLFTAHDALRQADGKPMPADAKDGVEEAREIIEGMIQSEVAPDA